MAAGHETRTVSVAELDFPLLRSKQDWDNGQAPAAIANAQQTIRWAEHLLIIHPLWIGSMPALLKAFFEQALRPGFAVAMSANGNWTKLLAGRSARVVVTMGMPAIVYRFWVGAHGLKSLTQNLALVGIASTRSTLIGMVEGIDDAKRQRWLERMRALGKRAR
jgi:putative NADPH-quinone reductase